MSLASILFNRPTQNKNTDQKNLSTVTTCDTCSRSATLSPEWFSFFLLFSSRLSIVPPTVTSLPTFPSLLTLLSSTTHRTSHWHPATVTAMSVFWLQRGSTRSQATASSPRCPLCAPVLRVQVGKIYMYPGQCVCMYVEGLVHVCREYWNSCACNIDIYRRFY